ncbi:MAG: hypothetical protein AB8G18_07145 [Gammaproteobacteria bacterium]
MIAALIISGTTLGASANSAGFDSSTPTPVNGQLIVSVVYEFTEFSMFGGGLDLVYDTTTLEFVSFEHGPFQPDVQAPASPEGVFIEEGLYEGFGLVTFEFFNGINSAGTVGTFTFNILDIPLTASTPCGETLCLTENAINPFVSLAGDTVGAQLLANGSATANLVTLPVPAAVWLMLSGFGALLSLGRKQPSKLML